MNNPNYFDKLIDNLEGVAIFATNKDGIILDWSRTCEMLYGYPKEDIIGTSMYDTIIQEHQKELIKDDLLEKKSYNNEEFEFKRKDNTIFITLTNTTFVGDDCYFMVFDLSKTKNYTSVKNIVDPNMAKKDKLIVLAFDKNYKITSFNTFAQRATNYSEKEVLGKDFFDLLVPSSQKERVKKSIASLSKDRRLFATLSFPIVCKNGERKIIYWEKVIKSKKSDEEFFFLVGLNAKANEDKLNYLANYDSLTDLPNQNLLNERLELSIHKAARLKQNMITLFLNIENFKSINHTFGFEFGNKLLKEIGYRLSSNIRDYDTLARFSADEFVMIFENITDDLAAEILAKRVNELFSKPFKIDGNEIDISINQGLCFFPDHGNDPKTLIKNANLAMNYAKKANIKYQIYTSAIHDELINKTFLENNLKTAIKEEQFYVVYQPIVDIKDKKIIGAEALIRWEHPELKNIPPLDFIPLAEDNGLIHKIGKIVLKDAVNQTAKWHKQGFDDITISVNISGVQLFQSDLVSSLDTIIFESGLDTKYIKLELTESVLMQNIELASNIMKKFNKKGIEFSIDDFGTGYSSFQYLSKLPISTLKIDQSFIEDMIKCKNDRIIVEAIISMAHSLSLNVIAEGVENKEQYMILEDIGCDNVQGYYLGKPLSSEEFTKLLEKEQKAEKMM